MCDDNDDTHFCLRCKETISGLSEYVQHRTNGGCRPSEPYLSDTRKTRNASLVYAARDDEEAQDSSSSEDDMNHPPRGHTGGKWIPGQTTQDRGFATIYLDDCDLQDDITSLGLGLKPRGPHDVGTSATVKPVQRGDSLINSIVWSLSCDRSQEQSAELVALQKSAVIKFPFICHVCRFYALQLNSFVWHLNSPDHKNQVEEFRVICKLCNVILNSISAVIKHLRCEKDKLINSTHGVVFSCMKSVSKISLYSCQSCAKKFRTSFELKQHSKKIHNCKWPSNVLEKRFKCSTERCDYAFRFKKELLEHERVHSLLKPFKCDKCDYSSKSVYTLRKHSRKHSKEKSFKCDQCKFATKLSANLLRHKRTHSGLKPYKCPYCTYTCNTQENLRKHVLKTAKHAGRLVYPCSKCAFGTNVFSDHEQHLKTCTAPP